MGICSLPFRGFTQPPIIRNFYLHIIEGMGNKYQVCQLRSKNMARLGFLLQIYIIIRMKLPRKSLLNYKIALCTHYYVLDVTYR